MSHKPQRTCVVCRSRKEQDSLLSFILLPQGIVFDLRRRLQKRKYYLCRSRQCLMGLDKWERQQLKRRFAITNHKPVFSAAAAAVEGEKR
ncbi:MAG TPA: YlxR family protein [Candidatus Cloacimonadota bacterium]|nr:YlxR family protein [Candidatus Cloacimonadota bacterium]HOR58446.1 YlxR family protein [Candidatus Cloacimonadota bacterium]HRS49315.1 YlxR family protein [Candidatus Cloacimonadota bacterium]